MIDEAKKSHGAWWQTVPGILTALGTIIAALAALIVALNQAGMLDCIGKKCTPDYDLDSFIGKYDYRSTPDDVDHGPLIDEKGNRCYQFIGELSIQKDSRQEYSINATRYYCVSFDKALTQVASVKWEAKSDDVFIPQRGEGIIFFLTTKKEPPNRGLVKASITERTKEGKARIISGTMLYLIPRKVEKERNFHWLAAEVEFHKKDNDDNPNYFIGEKIINDWFESKKPSLK